VANDVSLTDIFVFVSKNGCVNHKHLNRNWNLFY